jgi:hypothetical protein
MSGLLTLTVDLTGALGATGPSRGGLAAGAGVEIVDRGDDVMGLRGQAKQLAGRFPWAPDVYQGLVARGRPPTGGFSLPRLERALPGWTRAVEQARSRHVPARPRHVLVVGCLPWWLELSAALGQLLASRGHDVDLGFIPYRRWTVSVDPFDEGRQRSYLRSLIRSARPLNPVDLSAPTRDSLPAALTARLEHLSMTDVEYTLQREEPDVASGTEGGRLLALRRSRNHAAAAQALRLFRRRAYDVVVIPNGSILEFGAVYQTARFAGVPTVTYEFGEQKERVWICRDGEAMRLDTGDLWSARGATPLDPAERQQIEALIRARKGGVEWQQFGRLWQRGERHGAGSVRADLELDDTRPVVLLATNSSAMPALNRQIFTGGMAAWLRQTLR